MDKKALTLPILLSLVVGNMIGTGIYILPAALAQYGTISLFSWIFTSIGAILLAITFANLNKRFSKTGGPYIYCKEAFGKLVGFIIAYTYWFSNLVSIAGIAVASVGYLGFIFPSLNANNAGFNQQFMLILEIGVVWIFTLINLIGIHTAGLVQLFLTVIKVLPLILIIALGFKDTHWENLTHWTVGHETKFSALSSAAALTFWAFIGLESATIPAENTTGWRDIAKATILGTLITSLVYILSTFVLLGTVTLTQLQSSQFPFADAASILFGSYPAAALALCAVLSGLGALNACILIQGQIVFAAARDHLFPKIFAKLSKHDVPVSGQILSTSLVTLLLIATMQPSLLAQFNNIALLAGFLTLVTYLVSMLAEIKFLSKAPRLFHSFSSRPSLLIAVFAGLYTLWMISSLNFNILLIGCVVLIFCLPIYFFIVRKYAN